MIVWVPFLYALRSHAFSTCPIEHQGDKVCDRICMTTAGTFDRGATLTSDCFEECSAHCSSALLRNGGCDVHCNTWDCAWDQGDCATCADGCPVASIGNGVCDAACDSWACGWDNGDCANSSHPTTVFVAAGGVKGDGSALAPFNDITEVLIQLFLPYNKVVLKSGIHFLNPGNVDSLVLLSQWGLEETRIEGETCESCEVPELHLTRNFASFSLSHSVTLFNLHFIGSFDLKAGCSLPTCTYCPYVSYNDSVDSWVSDRGESINPEDYALQELCDVYHEKVFITVGEGANVVFEDVTFRLFRQQLKALIENRCGDLVFRNVNFEKDMPSPQGLSGGLIQHICPVSKRPYNCGSMLFDGGFVSFLNDGYEYRPDIVTSGFLMLQGIRLLRVLNVTFQYNSAMIGFDVDSDLNLRAALIYLTNFRQLEIADCTFLCNMGDIASAVFINSDLTFPLVVQDGQAMEQQLLHIVIRDCTFHNNTAQRGAVVLMNYGIDHQNMQLARLRFLSNISLLAVIHIENNKVSKEDDKGLIRVVDGVPVFFPKRTVRITFIEVYDNYGQQILHFLTVANLELTDLTFDQNGESESGVTDFSRSFEVIVALDDSYMMILPHIPVELKCSTILSLVNVLNLTFQGNVIAASYCPTGIAGLSLSGDLGLVDIHDVEFRDCVGSGGLTLAVQDPLVFYNLVFRNNTNLSNKNSVCVDIQMITPTDVLITDSVFEGNHGWFGTIVFAINTRTLVMERVSLRNNTALYTCAGVLFAPLATGLSAVVFADSEFVGNSANSFGVITVMDTEGLLSGNSVARVDVQIKNSIFTENSSGDEGAAITLGTYIDISFLSSVTNCTFKENSSSSGAALFVEFQTGTLTVSDCQFLRNAGVEGSALFLGHFPPADVPSEVLITHCQFSDQQLGPAVRIEGTFQQNIVHSDHNTFLRGIGAYETYTALLVEEFSTFTFISSDQGAVVDSQLYSSLSFRSIFVSDVHVSEYGGAFYVTGQTTVTIDNAEMYRCSATEFGGVFFLDEGSKVTVNISIIRYSSAAIGSVIYASPADLTITNCTITDNFASDYASVMMAHCLALINNSVFRNNTAQSNSPGLVISSCTATIEDSLMEDQTANNGAFIQGIDHNQVTIRRTTFRRGVATQQGGAIFATIQSDMTIEDSLFEDCSSHEEGGGIAMQSSTLIVRNTTFRRPISDANGAGITLRDGNMKIEASVFEQFSPGACYINGAESVLISSSLFIDGVNDIAGALEVRNVPLCVLTANNFINNNAETVGAVLLMTDGSQEDIAQNIVSNNLFQGNRATDRQSGALSCQNIDARIEDNEFRDNSALGSSGSGGATTTSCPDYQWCNITIARNAFLSNSATNKGGAIYWTDSSPQFSANTYQDNTAAYGNDVAAYAVQLAPVALDNTPSDYISTVDDLPLAMKLTNVASGQRVKHSLSLGLFDQYRQLLTTDSLSSAKLGTHNATTAEFALSGNVDAKAASGVITISDFTLVAEPGSTKYLAVTTNGIDLALKDKARDGAAYVPKILIEVQFRSCVSGESLQDNSCFICSAGTYSLDSSLPCLLCPSAATCYGNDTMVPKAGYWRISNDTDTFIECLAPEACLGSPDPPFLSLTGLCATGYSGNLCQTCVHDYSRSGRFDCSKCPSRASNVTLTVLVIILALTLVALIVWTAVKSAMRPQSLIAIYAKIFMNYLQMVVVSAALNLNWPTFVKTFLNGQQMAGGMAEQLFSFDCLLQDISISTGSLYFVKVQMYSFLPVGLFTLGVLTWVLLARCMKIESLLRKQVATSVIILFILHPSITKMMFSLFACMSLGDAHTYLINDLSIVCWDQAHVKHVLTVVVPSLVIFVFGLPMLTLMLLTIRRAKLEHSGMKLMLCFLYKGYQRDRFYWEFVILYRKVAMIAASVFLAPVSIRVQSLTVFAMLLFSLFLQIQINPFFDATLNRLEVKAILVSTITIYSGLYYDTQELSSILKITLFCVMIFANAYFLFSWVRLVSPVLLRTLRARFATLFNWRKNYKIQAMSSSLADAAEKSSTPNFSSDITNPHFSAHDAVAEHSATPGSYQDPANTSVVIQREHSEEEAKEDVHYTLVD